MPGEPDNRIQAPTRFVGKLALDTPSGSFLGDTRIRLLEAIGQHGSLSQAARAVPLSYKAAWDALDAMNNLADFPLAIRTTGGRNGGGTQLTDYGRKMIAIYRAMEREYQDRLDRMVTQLSGVSGSDIEQFRTLIKRMAMKTSARNQFVGTVSGLRLIDEGQGVKVCVTIDEEHEITASVTGESSENLGLRLGKEVFVLVKAPAVSIVTVLARQRATDNQISGTITVIKVGTINSEIQLQTTSGRIFTSVMPTAACAHAELAEGLSAFAVFSPASVLLAVHA